MPHPVEVKECQIDFIFWPPRPLGGNLVNRGTIGNCPLVRFSCSSQTFIVPRANFLVKGPVSQRPRTEGSSDAKLGFPFLIIKLVTV